MTSARLNKTNYSVVCTFKMFSNLSVDTEKPKGDDGRDGKKQQVNGPFCLTENSVEDRLTLLVCAESDLALLAKAQPANYTISRDVHHISLC